MSEAQASGGETASPAAEPSAPEAANDNSSAAPAKETPAQRKWRLKVEGGEHEVSEEELVALGQKGMASEHRFREAAEDRKLAAQERQQVRAEASAFLQRLQNDPLGAVAALEGDEGRAAQRIARSVISNPRARAVLEDALMDQMRYEGLSPEERAQADRQRSLEARAQQADAYEQRERQRQQQEQQTRAQAERQAAEARFGEQFAVELRESLTAAGLDPTDRDNAERWILERSAAIEHGVEMTAAEAARRVAERQAAHRTRTIAGLEGLEGEALLAALPKGVLAKIRSTDAAHAQSGRVAKSRAAQAGAPARTQPRPVKRTAVDPDLMSRAQRVLGFEEANRRFDAGEPILTEADYRRKR